MIRINLLAVERERTKRRATFQLAEKITVLCSLILVVTGVFLVWWWWTLSRQAADLERDTTAAKAETTRLKVIIDRVQKAEERRTQLVERVALIEDLRKVQAAPVHLLDEISRNLPDGMWLTSVTQKDSEVNLEGKCLVITAVSDLMTNLQASGYFRRPMDAPTIGTERNDRAGEIVKFTLKVVYEPPGMMRDPEATGAAAKKKKTGK